MSQARTSSAVGARPTPNVGDCADKAAPTATIIAIKAKRATLRQAIVHAPIGRDPPRLDGVVVARDAEARVERLVPVLRGLRARRLHRAELVGRGANVSEPFHFGAAGQTEGVDPERKSYSTFMTLNDPDGNTWLVQEVKRDWVLRQVKRDEVAA
jgi:hypothetical protein